MVLFTPGYTWLNVFAPALTPTSPLLCYAPCYAPGSVLARPRKKLLAGWARVLNRPVGPDCFLKFPSLYGILKGLDDLDPRGSPRESDLRSPKVDPHPPKWIPCHLSLFFGSEWNIVHIPHLNWFEAPGAAADLSLASLH
jgi:hypothetical protein